MLDSDAEYMTEYYAQNKGHLSPWEPQRSTNFHDLLSWQKRIQNRLTEMEQEKGAYFVAFSDEKDEVAGVCNLTVITRGAFQACFMGYSVGEKYERKGIASQLVQQATTHAFEDLKLNRVMANYMPSNVRSEKLLKKHGFVREGVAAKYIRINGNWEDHVLTSLLNPKNK